MTKNNFSGMRHICMRIYAHMTSDRWWLIKFWSRPNELVATFDVQPQFEALYTCKIYSPALGWWCRTAKQRAGITVGCHYTYITKFRRNVVCWTRHSSLVIDHWSYMSKTLRKLSTWMGDRLENNEVIQGNLQVPVYPALWMKKASGVSSLKKVLGAYVTRKGWAFWGNSCNFYYFL